MEGGNAGVPTKEDNALAVGMFKYAHFLPTFIFFLFLVF